MTDMEREPAGNTPHKPSALQTWREVVAVA